MRLGPRLGKGFYGNAWSSLRDHHPWRRGDAAAAQGALGP
jgi:hypothetical protein